MRIDDRELKSLFLVGGPRCGSTALARAIRKHPEVCFSRPKETYFFSRAEPGQTPEALVADFARRYLPELDASHTVVAEGTPHTIYDDEALERILSVDPEARLLVSVRNPVDLVYSHHQRVLYTLDEDEPDFATAWALQEERAAGRRLPKRCRDPRVIQYGLVGSLGARVEALFERVGRERCHVVVQDDFKADGPAVLEGIWRFLGVATDVDVTLKRTRESVDHRFGWLQPWVMNPPRPVMWVLERWERKGKGRAAYLKPLRKKLKAWNTRKAERRELDPALRAELADFFAADVEKLGKLLDRDLSHWR